MLNYSYKTKNPLGNFFNSTTQDYSHSQSSLNPKYLPYRPPNIVIPNQTNDTLVSPTLTPKTSRYGYEPKSAKDQSYNRTSTATPETDKYKKTNSFHTSTKLKEGNERTETK